MAGATGAFSADLAWQNSRDASKINKQADSLYKDQAALLRNNQQALEKKLATEKTNASAQIQRLNRGRIRGGLFGEQQGITTTGLLGTLG